MRKRGINNMINIASVGADLILMGVSESKIPLKILFVIVFNLHSLICNNLAKSI